MLSHDTLVELARRFLFRKCPIVLTELCSLDEQPDAIGWQDGLSTIIECKISTADFYADKRKVFRKHPYLGMGNFRYFLTPRGLLDNCTIPHGWGILETTGKQIVKKIMASHFNETNKIAEIRLMSSAIRRIGQAAPKGVSCKPYYTHVGDKATISIEVEW